MIGNEKRNITRIWKPDAIQWRDIESTSTQNAPQFTDKGESQRVDRGVKFGRMSLNATATLLVNNEHDQSIYEFADQRLLRKPLPDELTEFERRSMESTKVCGFEIWMAMESPRS